MRRSFRLCVRFASFLLLTAFLLQITAIPIAIAQPTTPNGEPGSARVVPPALAYRPPANANAMRDFAPADAEVKNLPARAGVPAAMPFNEARNSLVTIGNEHVGVFIEENTFNESVSLKFTEADTPRPANPQANEVRGIPAPPITATNTISNPLGNRNLIQFQLEVVKTARDEVVPGFDKPVRIVLDLRSLTEELNPVYNNFYLAYQDETDPSLWHDVPINMFQEDGLFSADVMHFSNWTAGVRPERWNPTWSPPTVSSFSGAATYSYPIEVPPGRNGMQPSVSLSYSSRSIDGVIRDPETGNIGTGWSLAEIKIVRVGVKLRFDAGNLPETYHPDEFRLVFNGTGYELYPADSTTQNTVRYHVKDAPGMFVERYYDSNHTETDGLYWMVITPDGTRYRLGWTDDSEEYQTAPYHYYISIDGHGGHSGYTSAIGWNVDTVTDPFGNQMTYHYYTRTTGETIGYWDGSYWQNLTITTRSSRIATIKYNYLTRVSDENLPFDPGESQLTSTPGTRVEFRASSGDSGGTFNKPITNIYIYHGSSSNPITEYRIDSSNVAVAADNPYCQNYDVVPSVPLNSNTWTVNSIQRWVDTNSDPTDADAGYALPPTTFAYSALPHYTTTSGNCFSFMYLTGYQNGYGGSVTFSYTSDNRMAGIYERHEETNYYWIEWPTIGYNYSVTQVLANDSQNGNVKTIYEYTQPCYSQWATPPANAVNCGVADSPEYGNIVGYQTTTQKNYDYNGTTLLNKQVTTFSQAANTTIGRPTLVKVYAGGSTLMSQTTNSYATQSINGLANMFTYTSQTISEQFSNGNTTPSISSKVQYFYDTNYQKDAGTPTQFGNLTHIYEYDDKDATVAYRTTRRWYDPNTTNWIISKPRAEGLYENNSWNLISGTWNYYDDSDAVGDAPIKGFLMRTRTVREITCGVEQGCDTAYETIDTTFGKDDYGNQATITTYDDYGYRSIDTNNAEVLNTFASSGRITTITYDADYHLYPVKMQNDLGITQFVVYGFKNASETLVPLPGFQEQPGLLKRVIEPNGQYTTYEYDPYGRLFSVYDHSDTSGYGDSDPWNGNPLTRYRYWDTTWNDSWTTTDPLAVTIEERPDDYPGTYNDSKHATIHYYDGFGREIQVRQRYMNVDGVGERDVVSVTEYNALGQVSCTSIPFTVLSTSGTVTDTCASKDHTTMTYDGLGRPLVTTTPDGSTTTNSYSILDSITVDSYTVLSKVDTIDGNGQGIRRYTNPRGELVLVRELTEANGWYADTRYSYNLQGNLELVKTSGATNSNPSSALREVSMTYDEFGRKTSMIDPDMGEWSYEYDAIGNLTRQEDANGNVLCFYYDELDRIIRRIVDSSPTDACSSYTSAPDKGSFHLASYSYAASGGGVGQIETVSWGPNSLLNSDTFTYDSFGRLVQQDREINGRIFTLETLSFDGLDRPLQVQYPNGEILTMTYDREGVNTLATGTESLISDVSYNARGQLEYIDRVHSWNLDTNFNYFGASDNFRLKEIVNGSNSDNRPDFSYTYDNVGNILSMETATSGDGTDMQDFTYDNRYRLETAAGTGNATNVPNYDYTYVYDKLGNITDRIDNLDSNNTFDYTYSTNHSQAVESITTTNDTYTFGYDDNGNMTSREDESGDYIQFFDVENRLTVVNKDGSGVTTFYYDAAGQRVRTVEPDGTIIYSPFPGYEEEISAEGYYWTFDEGSGSTANDSSFNQYDGTRQGPQWTTGHNGQALDFDGSNDYVAFEGSLEVVGGLTVSAWVRPETAPTGLGRLVVGTYDWDSDATKRRGWALGNDFGSVDQFWFRVFDDNGNSGLAKYNGFFDEYLNQWVHVTGVFRPGEAVELYINGQLEANDTTNVPEQIGQSPLFKIGARADTGAQGFWDGQIDEVRVIPRALDASEISGLMTANLGTEEIVQRTTYSIVGQAVFLRVRTLEGGVEVSNDLYAMHTDHLGSTSTLSVLKADGTAPRVMNSRAFYYPFGGYRYAPTGDYTDRGYTGHSGNNIGGNDIGLTYMNARYYVPYIYRMLTPDSIVPDPANPQSYNRYSYSYNNPINYSDPSGHNPVWCNDPYEGGGDSACAAMVNFDGIFTAKERAIIYAGATIADIAFMRKGSSFLEIYDGTVTFRKTGISADNLGKATRDQGTRAHVILVNNQTDGGTVASEGTMWVTHELGHSFNNALSPNRTEPGYHHGQGLIDLAQEGIGERGTDSFISGAITEGSWLGPYKRDLNAGYKADSAPYIQNNLPEASEDFADMFSNYVHNEFTTDDFGIARHDFMDNHMSNWIALAVSNNE